MSNKVRLKRTHEEEIAERRPEGLQNGGDVFLECTNCEAVLVHIFRTRPNEPEVWKLRATCPFCPPDKSGKPEMSFIKEVKGGFHVGGYGKIKEDNEDDDIPSTVVDPPEIEGDTFLFPVKKASPDAKPLKRKS